MRIPAKVAYLCGLVLCAALGGSQASAQSHVGAAQCVKCHTSQARSSWEKVHRRSGALLTDTRAREKATRYGGGNPQGARCLECHAPAGNPDRTVSCETCHGPGSGYRKPHARADFYRQPESQWLGMRNLHGEGNVAKVASLCVGCHVLDPRRDAELARAGHPTGASFTPVGARLEAMKHWPSSDDDDGGGPLSRPRRYGPGDYAAVTRAATTEAGVRLAALPASTAAAPAASAPTISGRVVKTTAVDPFFADQVEDYVPGTLDTRPARRPTARTIAPSVAAEPAVASVPPPAIVAAKPIAAAITKPRPDLPSVQGRLVAMTRDLLLSTRAPLPIAEPAEPGRYGGTDGELLLLQDETIRLALELARSRR